MEQHNQNYLIRIERIGKKIPKKDLRQIKFFAKSLSEKNIEIEEIPSEKDNKSLGIKFKIKSEMDKKILLKLIISFIFFMQNQKSKIKIDSEYFSYHIGKYLIEVKGGDRTAG